MRAMSVGSTRRPASSGRGRLWRDGRHAPRGRVAATSGSAAARPHARRAPAAAPHGRSVVVARAGAAPRDPTTRRGHTRHGPTRRRRSSFPERGKGTDGRRAARGPRYMSARPAPASSTLAPSAARPGVRSRILSASPPRPRPGDPPRRARRTHPTRVPGGNEGRRARERTSTAQYASGRNAPAAGAAGGTEPRASNR